METVTQNLKTLIPEPGKTKINLRRFVGENITKSWLLLLWLIALTVFSVNYVLGQLTQSPVVTAVVLIIWAVTVTMTVMAELKRDHTPLTFWLRNNMYNSITNIQMTVVLVLLIFSAVRGFYSYALVNASFEDDPITSNEREYTASIDQVQAEDRVNLAGLPPGTELTRVSDRNLFGTPLLEKTYTISEDDQVEVVIDDVYSGAAWGAVVDNFENLFIFRFKDEGLRWRLEYSGWLLVLLAVPSFVVFRSERYRNSPIRRVLTTLWFLAPIIIYILLRGPIFLEWFNIDPASYPFPIVNPDNIWGGFLLTIIIAVFAIVVSFPLGLVLALGRRSKIQGIPAQFTYPAAAVLTLYFLATSTPENIELARSNVEYALAYWPLLIPVIAYFFQHNFDGNVVAAFSTIYIEVVRGVPLITVLFMAIILFPIFLPPDVEVLNTSRVLWAFALFSAAYLAENVRGGLQALSNGQYEAADALGFSTYKKYRLIILPQALRTVIPAIVGQFISLFKDTSLVYLVGLFDFLNVANGISSQPDWLGIRTEPYILVIFVFFLGSTVMSAYSRRLERQLGVGER